ncbi:MAG: indole-3-glycerol phosphate synthase TrpC [Nitrospira sp.]|nr:indole-3-glycerol phosphate synthase TrpC [Nitrospira sp.]
MSILNQIIEHKKEELETVKRTTPLAELKARIGDMEGTKSFMKAIKRDKGSPIKLIAELKKSSPSKGLIRDNFSLPDIVSVYDRKDVAAISVLTEQRYFSGELDYLNEARKLTEKPLLRKDFLFDDYQIYEARANNADAILLIAAALERPHLCHLYGVARELLLDCLVEVHTFKELDMVLQAGPEIIGINNRDLKTLEISLDTTFEFLKDIPEDRIVISESGISTRADVEALEATRVDSMLIGTSIMKSADIGLRIDELTGR